MLITGLSRRALQSFEEARALLPVVRGYPGSRSSALWHFGHLLGASYGMAFLRAGCHRDWANAAAAWVAQQDVQSLAADFAAGRTLLSMAPDGSARLVGPTFRPSANSRAARIMAAELNLARCYQKTLTRAKQVLAQGAAQALADLFRAEGVDIEAGLDQAAAEADAGQAGTTGRNAARRGRGTK
jgi:hypothetical protein